MWCDRLDKRQCECRIESMKMKSIAPVFSVFLIFCGFAVANNILDDYKSFDIIPDVLNKAPNSLLKIHYNENELQFSKELTPTQVKDVPTIEWNFDPSSFCTLVMNGKGIYMFPADPDAPSRQDPRFREFLHWLVVNIPGDKFSSGENLAEYVGSGAPKDSGFHRYLFSVYKQPGKLNFSEKPISSTSLEARIGFNLQNFAAKYNLEGPIAGNLFQAQYDDYVKEFYKKMGVTM